MFGRKAILNMFRAPPSLRERERERERERKPEQERETNNNACRLQSTSAVTQCKLKSTTHGAIPSTVAIAMENEKANWTSPDTLPSNYPGDPEIARGHRVPYGVGYLPAPNLWSSPLAGT